MSYFAGGVVVIWPRVRSLPRNRCAKGDYGGCLYIIPKGWGPKGGSWKPNHGVSHLVPRRRWPKFSNSGFFVEFYPTCVQYSDPSKVERRSGSNLVTRDECLGFWSVKLIGKLLGLVYNTIWSDWSRVFESEIRKRYARGKKLFTPRENGGLFILYIGLKTSILISLHRTKIRSHEM